MKWRVLISCPHLQNTIDHYRDLFAKHDVEIELPDVTQQLKESELLNIIDRFDGMIVGDDEVTAKVLEKGKRLKALVKWGIGLDSIDLETAKRLGIHVLNTPNVFGDEVADVVMGYIILLARQLHKIDQSVRSGEWKQIRGISLANKTLGVIGLGNVGQAVMKRAKACGMSVIGYDVFPVSDSFIKETCIRFVDFDKLLKVSDFITLCCNLTSSNYHMLNHREFDLMKKGVYIINVSRGALIDEIALVKALEEDKVEGAALDVFEQEPLPSDSPLRLFDKCIFGAHNSSNTQEAVMRVNELTIQKLLNTLEESK